MLFKLFNSIFVNKTYIIKIKTSILKIWNKKVIFKEKKR